jgi:ATP-dependent protease ClpP protease subunit
MKTFRLFNSLRRQRPPSGIKEFNRTIGYSGGQIEVTWNENGEEATIAILDTIGKDPWTEGGFTEKDFRAALAEVPRNKNLNLLINSKGGDVFEGLGIKNAIADWPNKVTATITGVAASTASWMILDADEVRAPKASQMYIHDAMAIGFGDASKMRETADKLDKTSDQIASFYAAKNGKSTAEMRAMMKKNTLMTGIEAKNLGLVDVITDDAPARNFSDSDITEMNQRMLALNSMNSPAPKQGADKTNHNKENKMKDTMIALLNEWGVKIPDNATEDQLKKLIEVGKPENNSTVPPQPNAPQNNDKIIELEKKLEAQRVRQVTREFNELSATRPTLNRDEWLPKVIADESLMNLVRDYPESPEPLGVGALRIENKGNPIIEQFNKLPAGAERKAFLAQNYAGLRGAMHSFNPKNANTIDAALVTAHLSDGLVVVAQNRLAMLSLFSRDFTIDTIKPLATVQVRKALTASTSQQDPTDFEVGNSNLDNIAVTMHQEAHSFHISNADMLNGVRLEHLADINGEAFANTISDRVTAFMLVANYGAALIIGSAANFDPDDLSPILAVAKNYRQKNLILDGGHLAYITPKSTFDVNWQTGGAFGFDKIAEQNRYTGATANTVGFVCGPDAIGVASGLAPQLPAGEFISMANTTLKNGLTVRTAVWFSRGSRNIWCAHDVMFGAAAGDTTQAELLVTA